MKTAELRKEVLSHPIHWLAFGLPAGLAPFAPGTFGSIWGIALAIVCVDLPIAWQLGIALAGFLVGIYICGESAKRLGIHDHSGIVWDEIVGCFLVGMCALPSWPWWLLAFGLFRLFDIVKPPPIRDLDHRLKGGLGIMLDDIAAAVYAIAVLWVIQRVIGG